MLTHPSQRSRLVLGSVHPDSIAFVVFRLLAS